MDTSYALPNDLRAEIETSVMSILQRAISASSASRNPETVPSIIESAHEAFNAATAATLTWRNAQYSLQDRLPTELWYLVWSKLNMFDCFSVTHVCSRWREAALHCASMWSHIDFYTSVHNPMCTCSACPNGGSMSIHDSGWSGSRRYPERSSNWRLLPLVLSHSSGLPLSVTVEVLPSYASDTMIRRLGSALFPHAARLTDLTVLAADAATIGQFLRCFDVLPALRTLTASHVPASTSGTEPLLSDPIRLPALTHLDLATDEITWPSSVRLALPMVTMLSFRVADRRDILSALRVCTGLSSMHIRLQMFGRTQSSLDIAEMHERAATIESVSITNIAPSDELWLVPAFQHPGRKHLELQYYGLPVDGLKMFSDLGPVLDVAVPYSRFGDTISASDDDGRTRTLHCAVNGFNSTERVCSAVWPHLLPAREIRRLTLESGAWDAFVATFPRDELSLTRLELVVSDSASLASVAQGSRGRLTFACLTLLRLARIRHQIPLPACDVAAFLGLLDAPVRLEELIVARPRVPEEDGILEALAASVSFEAQESCCLCAVLSAQFI